MRLEFEYESGGAFTGCFDSKSKEKVKNVWIKRESSPERCGEKECGTA